MGQESQALLRISRADVIVCWLKGRKVSVHGAVGIIVEFIARSSPLC